MANESGSGERVWSGQQNGFFTFVKDGEGHGVLRARAGTGKTTTIVAAIAYIAITMRVLYAAFNKTIALELGARLAGHSNADAKTLHSLGGYFLRRRWPNAKPDKTVDKERALKVCGTDAPDEIVACVYKLTSLLKNCMPLSQSRDRAMQLAQDHDCEPDEDWAEEGWTPERVVEAAFTAREAAKERDLQGRISFDDMIFLPLAFNMVRPTYDVVFIDEAQDMNEAQLLLAQRAVKRTGRIIVVGDDRQAIYGFRGADSGSLDRLKHELRAKEMPLNITYRCGKKIVEVAQKLVPDFVAAPTNADGIVDSLPDEDALLAAAKPGDFILCRRNAPLMGICLGLLKRGIPAQVRGKDVGAGLLAIVTKVRAKSVPDFIERLGGWQKKEIARATAKVEDEDARQAKVDRITDQAEALTAIAEGCASIHEVSYRIETLFGLRKKDEDDTTAPPHVNCSSIHKSKGLEADRVFILREEQKRKGGDRNPEESANIEYVAVTRAKKHLTNVTLKGAISISSKSGGAPVANANQHVGTVGKREVFRLTVKRVIGTQSGQWNTQLHIMADAAGNTFKWFASNTALDEGKTYDVKATVKSHEVYKGQNQTIITRCDAKEVKTAEAAS